MKRNVFLIVFAAIAVAFPVLSIALEDKEMPLNWRHKDGETVFQFQNAKRFKERMMINLLVHNTHKTAYQCFFVTAGEKAVILDNNTGYKYRGAGLMIKTTADNKLAPNQKSLIALTFDELPQNLPRVLNFHFGLFATSIDQNSACADPIVDRGYNFNKQNVDASRIKWP
jgi:hypothetical protein